MQWRTTFFQPRRSLLLAVRLVLLGVFIGWGRSVLYGRNAGSRFGSSEALGGGTMPTVQKSDRVP